MRKQQILAGALILLSGCGDPSSKSVTGPTVASPTVINPPPSSQTWLAQGIVFHTDFQVCGGCVVEVVDGPRAGTTLADSKGQFSVDVPSESPQVTLRAMKEGYRSLDEKVATRETIYSAWVNLHVVSVLPPAPLGGAYRMTLEADPVACTGLPPPARAREYDIVLNSDARLRAYLFQAEPVGGAVERFDMYAGVSGNDVGVSVWHADDESAGIVERLNGDTGESFSLLAWTEVSAPYAVPLTVTLKGGVTWCPTRSSASCVVCESSGHRLALVPR